MPAVLTAGADFAKGSRSAPGAGSADITPLRRLGNKAFGLAGSTHVPHPPHRLIPRL
jgi:hypothetical protein